MKANANNTANDGNFNNTSKNSGNSTPSTWGTKVGYIGTGIVVGLAIYPFARKAMTKLQPGLDGLFDNLTGKAEGLAERASDLLAKARHNLSKEAKGEATPDDHTGHAHAHPHDHSHT